ncbi:hypothetical protein QUF81_10385 [Peribacillus simplex]|uniref:Uncharacterized protein n=1 Tax=Peribacillus simplex TaxID=1478 RepID=A0AAW7IBR6_9BACI|nr:MULTISPECIES: hypothetical protein [Peribacillus]SNS66604.1 hypothetical protein SAMN05444672_101495 [Bacillus sp. OK838]MDF9760223.1 hypothetical protein [Peribacillus simplex]MDM5293585.1 hypothetical protein [Peribacillus simplex]MDM5452536.1 hypothetical protein [Peribacillus simplex]MDV7763508.1 hypothetical protein [Peribacillus sp. CSMR9]
MKKKFSYLFGPTFLAIIILLLLDGYRQYAIVPVLIFWIALYSWDTIEKRKKAKENS